MSRTTLFNIANNTKSNNNSHCCTINGTIKFISKADWPNEHDFEIATLIQRRRLQILIHSCIYYRLNDNLVSDSTWSNWANELYELQIKYPQIANKICFDADFKNFDPSSGFNLPITDEWVMNKAEQLLKIHK